MNAMIMNAVRIGRIPVIVSNVMPAALADQVIRGLEEELDPESEQKREVLRVTAPEAGDFRAFLRGMATILLNHAGFRNRFDGMVVLEVNDAEMLENGSILLALLELIRQMSTGRTVIVGSTEDARRLTAAAGRFAIPALIQAEQPLKPSMERMVHAEASRLGLRFTSRDMAARVAEMASELEDSAMFSIEMMLQALSEDKKTISTADLERECAVGGYVAMCKALLKDRLKKQVKKRMGFQSVPAEERAEDREERVYHVA